MGPNLFANVTGLPYIEGKIAMVIWNVQSMSIMGNVVILQIRKMLT